MASPLNKLQSEPVIGAVNDSVDQEMRLLIRAEQYCVKAQAAREVNDTDEAIRCAREAMIELRAFLNTEPIKQPIKKETKR